MAKPYNRANIHGGGGNNLAEVLGAVFGALGGGEVEAKPYGAEDIGLGMPVDTGRIEYKPKHGVLNVLSGGQGSTAVNQANLAEAEAGQELGRRKDLLRGASDIRVGEHKQLQDQLLDKLLNEKFANDTGLDPRDPDYQQHLSLWKQRQYDVSQAEQEQAKAIAVHGGKTAEREEDIGQMIHGPRKYSAGVRAYGDMSNAEREAFESMAAAGRQPDISKTADINADIGLYGAEAAQKEQPNALRFAAQQAQDTRDYYPTQRNIDRAKNAVVTGQGGAFYPLSGEYNPFPLRETEMQGITSGLLRKSLNLPPSMDIKGRIGAASGEVPDESGRVFIPTTGRSYYPKPKTATAPANNRFRPAPYGDTQSTTTLAPASPFSSVPVVGVGGAPTITGAPVVDLNPQQGRAAMLQRLKNIIATNPQAQGVPSGNLDAYSDQDLQELLNRIGGGSY